MNKQAVGSGAVDVGEMSSSIDDDELIVIVYCAENLRPLSESDLNKLVNDLVARVSGEGEPEGRVAGDEIGFGDTSGVSHDVPNSTLLKLSEESQVCAFVHGHYPSSIPCKTSCKCSISCERIN